MADDLTSAAAIASGVLTALIGVPMAVHRILKVLRMDKQDIDQVKKSVDLVESQNKVIANLNDQIEKRNERIDELTDRLDKMAKERNDALIENATLKSQVNHLTENLTKAAHHLRNANQKIEFLMIRQGISPDDLQRMQDKLTPPKPTDGDSDAVVPDEP